MPVAAGAIRASVICVVSFLLLCVAASAQSSNGTLVGVVTDPTGASVPAASVKVASVQYGVTRESHTDAVGAYRIEGLQPGTYFVTFTATGFSLLTVNEVVIQGSVTTTVNGGLKLGSSSITVTVEAGANQAIDTQSGALGESFGQVEVANLPYASFNPAELAFTLPGVQDTPQGLGGSVNATFSRGISFSVDGSRPRANYFLMDGQDNNNYQLMGQGYPPNDIGLIQDFTILTNSYSAQYGHGGGAVANYITKSGGNDFHGAAWEVVNNSVLQANEASNKFLGLPKPMEVENVFGFDVGGPAIKDKLFFFGTAQWDRDRQRATGTQFALPDANGIATLTSLASTNPNAKIFLESLGGLQSPSGPACKSGTFNENPGPGFPSIEMCLFARSHVPVVGNDRVWSFRMDFHPTAADTITGDFLRENEIVTPAFLSLPPFDAYQGRTASFLRGQWSRVLSPTLLNEFRFSYTDVNEIFSPLPSTLAGPLGSLPLLQFTGLTKLPTLGINGSFPSQGAHKSTEIQEAVTRTWGKHTFLAGGDLTYLDVRDEAPFSSRGAITFLSGGGFDALGNFLGDFTGPSGSITKTFGNPFVSPTAWLYQPYFQDTWNVKQNLTLSLGLRYEYWGTLGNSLQFPAISSSVFGVPGATFPALYTAKQKPDRNNFAPRVSFAYTPNWGRRWFGDGQTVLRGGYGIFYDGLFTNIVDNTVASNPNATGQTIVGGAGRGQANALEQLASMTPTLSPAAISFTIPSNLVSPLMQQWNFDVQRALPAKFVLTISYVGSHGTRLFANQDLNPTVNFGARVNRNFGEIVVRSNSAKSSYHSGQLELERKLGTALTFRASYTYAKFLDDASEVYTITPSPTGFSQDLQCQTCDWGPSSYDRRHRFTVSYVWALPYASHNWLARALTDQWQWAGISTFETGTPNSVVDGFDNIGNGHFGARPNLSNPKQPITAIGIDGGNFLLGLTPGVDYSIPCLNSTAPFATCVQPASSFRFIIPAIGAGNLGRNAVYGPGQVYFDTSLQRTFPIPMKRLENQSLMFRAEFFNAFNHPNLFTPTYVMIDPNYAQAKNTVSGGREIKLWLKYSF